MSAPDALAYRTVILDVDSTVAGIEGIDWLARRRSPALAREVASLTDRAMAGEIALEQVYGERVGRVAPSRDDVAALAEAYLAALAPGCADAVRRLRERGARIVLLSGGLREAILPLARTLGVPERDVHAVGMRFDAEGRYAGVDPSPLTTDGGKPAIVRGLALERPVLAVGDGNTDLALRGTVDTFAAFVGFVRREPVVREADVVVESFDDVMRLVEA